MLVFGPLWSVARWKVRPPSLEDTKKIGEDVIGATVDESEG